MTPPEDNQRDEPGGPRLDEEALWRSIVENYGERPSLVDDPLTGPPTGAPAGPAGPAAAAVEPAASSPYPDEVVPERAEEHFVPPVPPPLPRGTPARRMAWAGLLAPPVLMLLAVVLGWTFPTWASMLLVAAFVGGFVFLVATMPRDGGGDGWDDGAVV